MRFQFSLRELLALAVFVAVGCAGFLHPSPCLASVVFTLTVAALFWAVLAAAAKRSSARAFWIGFAIAGWGYLWVAHWPDENAYSVVPQWELQTSGPLLTTKLLNLACTAIHGASPSSGGPVPAGGGGFFSVPVAGAAHGTDRGLGFPWAQFGGIGGTGTSLSRAAPPDESMLLAFMRIGHSLWTLLFAYLGGRLARHFHDGSRRAATGAS